MKKEIIGLFMLVAISANLHAQDSRESTATIALAKKIGLEKISNCSVGLYVMMTTYDSMKNSSNQAERDTYKGMEQFALTYIELGETFGKEEYRAEVKKASASAKGVPDEAIIKSAAQNCFGDEIITQIRDSKLQQSAPVAQAPTAKKQPQEKCYLNLIVSKPQDDQIINSCDIDTIKNSLLGYNRALLQKFKNNSIIEQTAIFSNEEAALFADGTRGTGFRQTISTVLNYEVSGNLTTYQIPAGGNCFVTYEVEEKNGYRKEFYKSASSGCSEAIVNANIIGLKNMKSGEQKGKRIIID
jgi:hypothetical protein